MKRRINDELLIISDSNVFVQLKSPAEEPDLKANTSPSGWIICLLIYVYFSKDSLNGIVLRTVPGCYSVYSNVFFFCYIHTS